MERIELNPLAAIESAQNADGGWPYRKGSSWTEPTVYSLLAQRAARATTPGARQGLTWLLAAQRSDGGWPPRRSVAQSTWVTALVALLPPEEIGAQPHAQAVRWLMGQTGMESNPIFRWKEFLKSGKAPDGADLSGWPWIPGTAAWVTPTCLGILALRKCCRRQPSGDLHERLEAAGAYLLSRRCADGGWNHGSARALGYNSDSYPETTGQALLALAGTDPGRLQNSFAHAKQLFAECRSAGGAAWLRLGLLAHQQLPAGAPFLTMPCRTLPDAALQFLAQAAEQGFNAFLD